MFPALMVMHLLLLQENQTKMISQPPRPFTFYSKLHKTPTAFNTRVLYYDIFVNFNWVNTRWQWYSTHLHKNITWDNINNNRTTTKNN